MFYLIMHAYRENTQKIIKIFIYNIEITHAIFLVFHNLYSYYMISTVFEDL